MKKAFSFAVVLLVAALAFTSCSKDEANAPEESVNKSFSIVANLNDTKVTIDNALKSSWSDGDQMNVFHAATGTAEYTNDGKFTYGTSNSKFEGTLGAALTGNSDWYAFYPYSSHIKTPANTSTGYSTVGSSAGMAQTQAAKDDPTHLAGKNYPLAGKVANVEKSTVPTVTMKHVCAYAKVEVTNSLSEAIKVSKIEVAMPGKDVTGTYYVNFTDPDNCSFIGSGTNCVSDKAIVSVADGVEIAAGASASFYLGFVPQTLANGDKLSVSVTAEYAGGNQATQTNEKTLDAGLTFKAGHIKTLKFSYSKTYDESEAEVLLWSDNFATFGTNSTTFAQNSAISTYDYSGRSGAGDNALVTLTADASNNVRITTSNGANMEGGHLWFNKNASGELTTSEIKLYGSTSITLSFAQGTSGSSVSASYKIGEGDWTEIISTSGPNAEYKKEFSVPEGTASIVLKIAHPATNGKNTRVDNLKLVGIGAVIE